MLKNGSKITVHFISRAYSKPREVETKTTGHTFTVKTEGGKMGFDGNTNRSPYTCRGALFTPFRAYADGVIFKNIKTGKLYHYSDMKQGLEEVQDEEYLNEIIWL